jgi:hypothetical protein
LSATPNGKDHDPDDRHQMTGIRYQGPEPSRRQTLLLRRHFVAGHTNTASRPHAVSRYGHTTRFFTIVNQHTPPRSASGQGEFRCFSPRRRRQKPVSDI